MNVPDCANITSYSFRYDTPATHAVKLPVSNGQAAPVTSDVSVEIESTLGISIGTVSRGEYVRVYWDAPIAVTSMTAMFLGNSIALTSNSIPECGISGQPCRFYFEGTLDISNVMDRETPLEVEAEDALGNRDRAVAMVCIRFNRLMMA